MQAMVLEEVGRPMVLRERPLPEPGLGQVRLLVRACAICRTDLHIVDGELALPKLPLICGHQIVGVVEALGEGVFPGMLGRRMGVPWLGGTCGCCVYCTSRRENLCEAAVFTGYLVNGGFATHAVADARFCFAIPDGYPDEAAAPLLCGGLIGWRALQMTGDAHRVGFYGFGSAAHILAQVLRHQGRECYAFVRPGDRAGIAFAESQGAVWAGPSDEPPPRPLDAAIIFAPAGHLVPAAIEHTAPGGTIVCAGIHMSDVPSFPYRLIAKERQLRSVANLTRDDATTFLALAPQIPVRTQVTIYPLEAVNAALDDLRSGRIEGSGVIAL